MKNKKLQVFISSTYKDLLIERQAAVQAILSCGHIPAGMELFIAGDESQMEVIKRWIDESDIYLLILGGRYGSVESISGKSYTQLEYEYALEKSKPLFSVVIDKTHLEEKVKSQGTEVLEMKNQTKLEEFRDLVLTKLVKFYRDPKDIKLAIHETLADFERRKDIVGWVKGNETLDNVAVLDQITTLTKENTDLRSKLIANPFEKINGLSFEETELLMRQSVILKSKQSGMPLQIRTIMDFFGDKEINSLHFFILCTNKLSNDNLYRYDNYQEVGKLRSLGLLQNNVDQVDRFGFSLEGVSFLSKLKLKYPKLIELMNKI